MAIIIPSKKIYKNSNSIVNKNVITKVEYQVSRLSRNNKAQDILTKDYEIQDYATNEFTPIVQSTISPIKMEIGHFPVLQGEIENEKYGDAKFASVAGFYPIYYPIEFTVDTQLNNETFIDVSDLTEKPIIVSAQVDYLKRERIGKAFIPSNYSDDAKDWTFRVMQDYETPYANDPEYDFVLGVGNGVDGIPAPQIVTNPPIASRGKISAIDELYRYAYQEWKYSVPKDEKYDYIAFARATKVRPEFIKNEQTNEVTSFKVYLKVLCGAISIEGGGAINENYSRSISTKIVEYRPQSITLTVNAYTSELVKEQENFVKSNGKNGIGISITDNILLQNKDYASAQADNILLEYANGKGTAVLVCSVGDYYDDKGKLAITTSNANKAMIFQHYDKVVPMIRNSVGKDEAMSYNDNGNAKVFEVIGTKLYSDGAVWQELTLRESNEQIEIPSAEKLSPPTISISTSILTIVDTSGKAEKFEILIDSAIRKTLDAQSIVYFDLEELNLDYGSYKISVIANAKDYIPSVESNAITYVKENPNIETLPTPNIVLENDTLYIYGDTENAEKFEVWVNGSVKTTVTNTQILLTNLNLGIGTFTIFVVAKAKGYNDSAQSNSITYNVEKKTLLVAGKYVFNESLVWSGIISQTLNTTIVVEQKEYFVKKITVSKVGIFYTTDLDDTILVHNGTSWVFPEFRNVEFTENVQVTTTFYDWFTRNSEKQKISFSINDKAQIAEYDMSWYQWCNSAYNVDRWLVRANNLVEGIYKPLTNATVESVYLGDVMVSAVDKILVDTQYATRATFADNISSDEILDYVDENYYDKKYIDTTIDTKEQVLQKIKEALIDYATKTWVNDNFATEQEVKDSIRLALETWAEDNLSGYVTDAEMEQALVETLESFGIEHTITESGEQSLHIEGYAPRTEMSATIESKLGQFSAEYNKKFDSLSFGGRNLYTNSSDFSGSKWVNLDVWSKDTNFDSYGNVIMYKVGQWGGIHQIINAKAEEVYTLSATVFGDGACWGHFYASEYNSSGYLTHSSQVKNYEPSKLKSTGTRVFATYTVKTDCTLSFRIENSTADAKIKISSLKLERGTKPTDWTKAPEDTDEEFVKLSTDLSSEIAEIQKQIDGSITSWFYEVPPTLSNEPAVNWNTDELKNLHLGDLYYDTLNGDAYRWQLDTKTSTYSWVRIADTDATRALELAQNAQDTADSKRRIFVSTPHPPYDIGDMWAVTTTEGKPGDLMRCQNARASGSYVASDWVKATKYIDNQEASLTAEQKIQQIQIGGRNLAYYTGQLSSNIIHTGVIINSGNAPLSHRWNISKNDAYSGTYILSTLFETGKTYTISYCFKKTSGTLINIGGHISGFNQKRFSLDGKETSSAYGDAVALNDDTSVHYIVVTAVFNGGTGTDHFYIQPNRGYLSSVSYDLWDIKVEEGEKATAWSPAWEEYYTTVDTNAKIQESAEAISLTVSSLQKTLNDNYYTKAQIDVTSKEINQRVTAEETTRKSEISRVEGSITLGIQTDGNGKKYSYLNSKADYIHFSGNRFSVTSDKFKVGLDGAVEATGGKFSGEITATSLTLAQNVKVPTSNVSGLSTIATSGNYNDLSNRPTIPSKTSQLTNDSGLAYTSQLPTSVTQLTGGTNIVYKGDIKQEKKTDSNGIQYTETTVPTANGNVTYKTYETDQYIVFGRTKGTDSSGKNYFAVSKDGLLTARNAVIYGTVYATDGKFEGEIHATSGDIGGVLIGSLAQKSDIPTKVSDLNNDKNFATTGQLPTKTSQLTNDAGYTTMSEVEGKGYQTSSNVQGITRTVITSESIEAPYLKVNVANVSGLTADWISSKGITAQTANIANSITVGEAFSASASGVKIGGWTVNANNTQGISYGSLGASDSFVMHPKGQTYSGDKFGADANTSWRLGISDSFGVTKAGVLYAKGAEIQGRISSKLGDVGYFISGPTSRNTGFKANRAGVFENEDGSGYGFALSPYGITAMKDGADILAGLDYDNGTNQMLPVGSWKFNSTVYFQSNVNLNASSLTVNGSTTKTGYIECIDTSGVSTKIYYMAFRKGILVSISTTKPTWATENMRMLTIKGTISL